MAFRALISGVLLRAVILGFGQHVGTIPTRHVPLVTKIGKAYGKAHGAHGNGWQYASPKKHGSESLEGAVQGTLGTFPRSKHAFRGGKGPEPREEDEPI